MEQDKKHIYITSNLCYGNPPSNEWISLDKSKLIIISGLTGVGKTSVIRDLLNSGGSYLLLPNRRELTDKVIIPPYVGEKKIETLNRLERFEISRKFRADNPGGMGFVISKLYMPQESLKDHTIIFDNLRGENEIRFGIKHFPDAFFISLYASPLVRLRRLIKRKDAFDKLNSNTLAKEIEKKNFPAGFYDLITREEFENEVYENRFDLDEAVEAVRIINKEHKNYNALVTNTLLENELSGNYVVLNTDSLSLKEIQKIVVKKLQKARY